MDWGTLLPCPSGQTRRVATEYDAGTAQCRLAISVPLIDPIEIEKHRWSCFRPGFEEWGSPFVNTLRSRWLGSSQHH